MEKPRVVIIGAGFAGLYAARELCNEAVRVTILDRSNHHLFQPLLYQVATTGLSPGDIAQPIRHVFRKCRNIEVLLAGVERVDVPARTVHYRGGEILYDFLIVATGATHAYFGHEDWAQIAPGLKTLEDAVQIRRMFLTAFEEAEKARDPKKATALLNFVIVGAGPTGVELAGTMSEMSRRVLSREFRHINPASAKILLLEGGPRVLPAYSERLSASAQKQLEKLGVEVWTNSLVTRLEPDAVYIGEKRIETHRIFWAAGVAASPLGRTLGTELDRTGRVRVTPDLTVKDHPEIFVVGDLASLTDGEGKQVPGVAPAAIQMGRYAAKQILAISKNRPKQSAFVYKDKGSLATIGRAAAIGSRGKMEFSGFIAWLGWLLIHIFFLIGFRNRLFVLLQWAWSYIGLRTSARLITYYEGTVETETKVR
ncbi:NAD(P)/FAD-dependent oxidoreductase [bacterium]|nr:NAD(P)/FAD-dependent oxidoreductase [bacterium]MCI0607392.1 NAD(P)/FAD-dependent oxidoreductase [bacterium]